MVTLSGPEGTLLTVNLGTSVVLGASNLTTAGAVPYVTSSGTLGQAPITWDGSRYLTFTHSNYPTFVLKAVTASGTNASIMLGSSTARYAGLEMVGDTLSLTGFASTQVSLKFQAGGADIGFATSGKSWGFGPSNTAPTGTASILDRTVTTGATLFYVGTDATNVSATTCKQVNRAGTAQSTTNLHEWQSAAGGVLTAIAPGGGLILSNAAAPTLANSQFTMHLASDTSLVITAKGSDGVSRTVALTLA